MSKQIEKPAILFADISGSAAPYDMLGDEIMCVFPRAEAALRAACDMQEVVEKGKPSGDRPMYIRIGFHFGEVIGEDGDVFGDAVNVAARVTEVSRARQITATRAAVDELPPHLRDKTLQIRRTSVKGKQDQLDVFQVVWQDDMDVTRVGMPV